MTITFSNTPRRIIISAVLFFLILPFASHPAQAGVLESVGKFTGCTGGGAAGSLLTTPINTAINNGITKLTNLVPKLGNFFGGALGGEVPVNEGFLRSKESIMDVIARCAAREILSKMNADIVNLARTGGRNGGVTFVRNWRNFQTDAQYRGEGIFRGILASTNLCNYFGNELKNLFGAKQKINLTKIQTRTGNFDPFQLRSGCTLPNNFNINSYKQDFSGNGGWEAWSRLLEPQNNPYGSLFQSLDEANRQRALEESADLNQVIANQGLTGISGSGKADSCLQTDDAGQCLAYKEIKTPGTILGQAVGATFQQELAWVTNVDELNELIATAVELLINRLTDFSNPNEGSLVMPGEIDMDPNALPTPPPTPTSPPGPQSYNLSHLFVGERDVLITAEVGGAIRSFNASTGEKIDIFVDNVLKITCTYTPCVYAETNYTDGTYIYKATYTDANSERLYMPPQSFVIPASAPQPGPLPTPNGTINASVSGTTVTLEYVVSNVSFAFIERGDGTNWVGIAQLQGSGLPSGTITDNPPLSSFGQTMYIYRLMVIGEETNDEIARTTVLIISP